MGKIVWLASYPKSGNTWMRFLLYAYFSLEHREIDRIDVNAPEFRRMFTLDVDRQWFEPHLDKPWADASDADLARVRLKANESIAASVKGLVFVKTHHALINEQGAPTIHSGVTHKAIYIVRNPLDVVRSARNHFKLDSNSAAVGTINDPAKLMPKLETQAQWAIRSWRRNVESWADPPREGIFTVRYEDMLRKPYHAFASVIEFLGQSVDRDRLRRAIALTTFDRLKESETQSGFKEMGQLPEKFFRSGVAGGWRDELTEDEIRGVVAENADLMRKFGYLTKDLLQYVPTAPAAQEP